jgi:hypothetical protein
MQHDLEHVGAFLLLGFLLGTAFRIKIPFLLLIGTAFTLALGDPGFLKGTLVACLG